MLCNLLIIGDQMQTIPVRLITNAPIEWLWDNLYGNFKLKFDDGVVITTTHKEAIFNRYIWTVFSDYPNVPITRNHSITDHYKDGFFNTNTYLSVFTAIGVDIIDVYADIDVVENLSRSMYEVICNIYNNMTNKIGDYVYSIDILDFINLQNHPDIVETMGVLETNLTPQTISNAYSVIENTVATDKSLVTNGVVKSIRFGTANKNQMLQCIGPRGYITDLDFTIFEHPIARSFTMGMKNIYNLMIESRSAAKALYLSNNELKSSEYFARRLQLITMPMERIHYTDCGSTEYLYWRVRPQVVIDGEVVYPGDLNNLIGKYYLDEDTGKLKVINKDSTDIIDKTIKVRSVLYCKHPNKHGVCSTCFGKLAYSIPKHANIGNYSSSTMTKQTTQSILSTKHLTASTLSEKIFLTKEEQVFFKTTRNKSGFILNYSNTFKNVKMIIAQTDVPFITDLSSTINVCRLNVFRISKISNIIFKYTLKDRPHEQLVTVSKKERKASFTTEFLQYIRTNGYVIGDGIYTIDLSNWKKTAPIMLVPQMEYNYSSHGNEIAKLIGAKIDNFNTDGSATLESTLSILFDLVNSKLNVNLALLEVIIYAVSVYSSEDKNFGLSRGALTPNLESKNELIKNRSLSAQMGYNNMHNVIAEPTAFLKRHRPDHPMDTVICPEEVLNNI